MRSSWFAREEKREAALNHQGLKHETLSHVGLLLRPLWVHSFKCIVFLSFLFFIVYFSAGGNRFLLVDFAQRTSVRLQSASWFLWLNIVISIRHESLYVAILIMFQEIHVFFFFFLMFYYFLNTRIFAAQVLICNMMHCRFSCILTVTEGQVLLQRCVLVSQQRKLHIYCTFMQKSGMWDGGSRTMMCFDLLFSL